MKLKHIYKEIESKTSSIGAILHSQPNDNHTVADQFKRFIEFSDMLHLESGVNPFARFRPT